MRLRDLTSSPKYLLAAVSLAAASCNPFTDPQSDLNCPQTYEFGNSGCAKLLVILDGPPLPWPALYRWSVRALSADSALQIFALGPDPVNGQVPLRVTLWLPLAQGVDTASLWVVAKLLDDRGPIVVGVPLPVFAADSTLHPTLFAPVGERARTDTIRLSLK